MALDKERGIYTAAYLWIASEGTGGNARISGHFPGTASSGNVPIAHAESRLTAGFPNRNGSRSDRNFLNRA